MRIKNSSYLYLAIMQLGGYHMNFFYHVLKVAAFLMVVFMEVWFSNYITAWLPLLTQPFEIGAFTIIPFWSILAAFSSSFGTEDLATNQRLFSGSHFTHLETYSEVKCSSFKVLGVPWRQFTECSMSSISLRRLILSLQSRKRKFLTS